MRRVTVPNAVAVLLLLSGGAAFGRSTVPIQATPDRESIPPVEYARRIANLRLERDGLRARLAGVEARPPTTIFVTDTLVSVPDTVVRFMSVTDGELTVDLLIDPSAIDVADSLVVVGARPELQVGMDVSDCDDGWAFQSGSLICDRARLGHLWLSATAARPPTLGAYWKPSYGSPWEASVGFTGSVWDFAIRKSWGLF